MSQLAFLMRHATPDWSRTDIRYDIPPGPPLTAIGEAEAQTAGRFLDKQGITHIFASPLARTLSTARIVAHRLNLPVTIETQLAEWREDENEQDVETRSRAYWDGLWSPERPANRDGQGEQATNPSASSFCPLLITHGGPSRLLLQSLGADAAELEHLRAQFDHNNPMPPAGIWQISRSASNAPWGMKMVFTPEPFIAYPA